MKEQHITIQEYANHFGLMWLSGDREAMKRPIYEPTVNRPGLELACFFDYPRCKRLVFLGNKETAFIKTMSEENINLAFDFLMNDKCPGIVVCNNLEVDERIIALARKKNFPLFVSNIRTNDLFIETTNFLTEELAPSVSLHGTLMEVFSVGVIITGSSGIGKSETALELIKKGHRLVCDDRVDIRLTRGKLIGKSPELLKNMMEVRGIGIIDISKMFGINTIRDYKNVDLIIELTPFSSEQEYERLGSKTQYKDILGIKVPLICVPVAGARSIGDIIEVAVTNFKLKRQGYDSTHEFEERLNELLKRNG